MAGTIIPPAFNETTNPTLISFFLLQTIFPNCVQIWKSAKDLAVAFIRRTTGAVFLNVDYWFPVTRPMLLSSLSFSK
jgi:hypothetical protein